MNSATDKLADCLEDAERLISISSAARDRDAVLTLESATDGHRNLSPFKKLADIFSNNNYLKTEPIRVIQHLSCTGGTLFSKCIAAMPNIVLLSEVYPLSTHSLQLDNLSGFYPTDVITLARLGKAPAIDDLCEKIFLGEIHAVEEHLRNFGKRLVLREHSHSNFLGKCDPTINKTIPQILDSISQVVSIVTVRHPVDSYLSLLRNGWIHFDPKIFDEYCRRYLIFLNCNESAPVYKYEDLLESPEDVLQQICDYFKIPYNQDFQDYLEIVSATGDSGRRSIHIGKRKRRPLDKDLLSEVKASRNFSKLCELLGYQGV